MDLMNPHILPDKIPHFKPHRGKIMYFFISLIKKHTKYLRVSNNLCTFAV